MWVLFFTIIFKIRYNSEQVVQCYWRDGSMLVNGDRLGKVGTGFHTNAVAKTLADRLGGISYMIHSPAVLDSKEAKEIIEKDSNTKEIFDMVEKVQIALIGMSDIGPESTLIKTGNFNLVEFKYLANLGVVGDINLIFINEDGEKVSNKINERIITFPIEKVKSIENVIGVGFGRRKVEVIKGALRGKIINILVTDERTAQAILEN